MALLLKRARTRQKMSVSDPERFPPDVPRQTNHCLSDIKITPDEIREMLSTVDVNKATGPDNISPHTLKHCADQLAIPLAKLFQKCLSSQEWPKIWKRARVVAIHKKKKRTSPENYRPVSLLSVVAKILEQIIVI